MTYDSTDNPLPPVIVTEVLVGDQKYNVDPPLVFTHVDDRTTWRVFRCEETGTETDVRWDDCLEIRQLTCEDHVEMLMCYVIDPHASRPCTLSPRLRDLLSARVKVIAPKRKNP